MRFWNHPLVIRGRRWGIRLVALTLGIAIFAAGCEAVLEHRARARLTAGESFADVGGAQIRYRLLGAEHTGTTVVFLSGLGGSIEQMVNVQTRVAQQTRALAYDRGGYGFSTGSRAHNAMEQADELDGLLRVLKLDGPVVLVGFSSSGSIVRVFAARHPERVAGIYLLEPYMPELEDRMPGRKNPRRVFIRWIVHDLVTSTFGLKRLSNRLASFDGPDSAVEQRAEEVLQSRPHFWALAEEWYVIPETAAETKRSSVGKAPVVILFTDLHGVPEGPALEQLYVEFVARSPRGRLEKLAKYDHAKLLKPGPVLDSIVKGIGDLAAAPLP